MKLAPGPIETKVAATVGTTATVGGILSLVAGLASVYHWFTPPPPYLTALAVTVLSGILSAWAGWRAPHTPRTVPPTVTPGWASVTTTTNAGRIGGDPPPPGPTAPQPEGQQ